MTKLKRMSAIDALPTLIDRTLQQVVPMLPGLSRGDILVKRVHDGTAHAYTRMSIPVPLPRGGHIPVEAVLDDRLLYDRNDLERMAFETADGVRFALANCHVYDEEVRLMRRAAAVFQRAADRKRVRLEIIRISAKSVTAGQDYLYELLTVTIRALNDSLRPTEIQVHAFEVRYFSGIWDSLIDRQRLIQRRERLLRETGAAALIEPLALKVLGNIARVTRSKLLHQLITDGKTHVEIPRPKASKLQYGAFAWRAGVIELNAEFSHGVTWREGEFQCEALTLPETALAALIGKPVPHVLGHPGIPAELRVASCECHWAGLSIKTDPLPPIPVAWPCADLFTGPMCNITLL